MPATRYEILLPLEHNDGQDVDPEKIFRTKNELTARFGALSVDPFPLEGQWTHRGALFKDQMVKFVVDVEEDSPEVEVFFRKLKETLKKRFNQIDIWIVAFPIRII